MVKLILMKTVSRKYVQMFVSKSMLTVDKMLYETVISVKVTTVKLHY